jgi:23S rRNA (adenine2503-C2)-methyltransferase
VVYIPEEDRGTLCISSQVGCTLTCSFCHTGTQKLVRNLTAGEIVGQIMVARDDLDEWPSRASAGERPAAFVEHRADGHGRAALQFRGVRDAMKIAMDGEGFRSRAGGSRCRPAASCRDRALRRGDRLHAGDLVPRHHDEVRDVLVPINKRWNIATLLDALRAYPEGCRIPSGSPSNT